MTFQDLIEKLKQYPVPTVSGAVLIACLLALYFRAGALTELENKRDTVGAQAGEIAVNLVTGATLDEHVERMSAAVATLEERIIKPSELAENLKYFYGFESDTGVSLADLRQVPSEPPKKGAPKTEYAPVGFSVTLSATFAQVVSYFEALENGSRLYRLKNFNLQRGRDGESSVTLALNLELLGRQ